MPQEPLILEDTITNNISLFDTEKLINKKKIIQSLKRAQFYDDISRLKNNLETKIGNDIRLSLGQKRRLAIARTFYHDREILIFDEMTASLDKENEEFIFNQIKKLINLKTIIIISHNINLLKICKKIYKLKNGKLLKIK